MERWRDVVGYEGLYQVLDSGLIRSLDRIVKHCRGGAMKQKGQVLRATMAGKYLSVGLHKEGVNRTFTVHRLVAEAWIGTCPAGQTVRHGPAGRLDNSVGNLSYGTRSENQLDRRRDGTDNGKAIIRGDGKEFTSMAVAAEESGCYVSSICECCKGHRNTAGGYGWKYKEGGSNLHPRKDQN